MHAVAADWCRVGQNSSCDVLCTCLEAVPQLVRASAALPVSVTQDKGNHRLTERCSYPALLALVCATQMRTALALHDASPSTCRAEHFHCFWPSANSRFVFTYTFC